MNIFEKVEPGGYEQLVFCHDRETGLKAIISIHDTTLGPALGGVRMWPYKSEQEAVDDVLRLARGMTYKAAAAGLNLGGGKSVIIGDSSRDKTPKLLRAFGRFVESLGGRYITAEDVGTCQKDMDIIAGETKYVTGRDPSAGGSGDPSPFTALGVLYGIRAAVKYLYGTESLAGKRVAVQGTGNVGYHLCSLLFKEGVELIAADINQKSLEAVVKEFGAQAVGTDEIYSTECDIFAPCALGGIINDHTVERLRCRIVAGSANNVLLEDRHGELLEERKILYVPDYVINAGGLINVAGELEGYDRQQVLKQVEKIYDNVARVLAIASREIIPTYLAADRLAEERLRAKRKEKLKAS